MLANGAELLRNVQDCGQVREILGRPSMAKDSRSEFFDGYWSFKDWEKWDRWRTAKEYADFDQ
jgi:hypothetical protein